MHLQDGIRASKEASPRMSAIDHHSLFIGGKWVRPSSSARITVVGASTGELVGSTPVAAHDDVDLAVASSRTAFEDPQGWSSWAPAERAEKMLALASALEARAERIAHAVSIQNGMPISLAGQLETGMPVSTLRYFAQIAADSLADEVRPGFHGGAMLVRKLPIGVIAAIVPWNFPQTLAFTKIAPALAAGCTVVLKPSPETVLDSAVLAEAVEEADLPPGVINIIPGGPQTGAYLVSHPGISKVAFTGSTQTGRAIGQACGELLRPVSLELGGKSAAIVLDDANLIDHLYSFFGASLLNNGQTCYATTRVLASRSRYAEVVDILTAFVSSLRVGDPLDPNTQVGPLTSSRQRDRVEEYIKGGVADGARLTTGGDRPGGFEAGWYVNPTVLADVDNASAAGQE
jgi:aldehyde dehydrogenase (NAD+)